MAQQPPNPFGDLQTLIDESDHVFSQPLETFNVDTPVLTKPSFNSNHSKVLVLENKIVKPVDATKEERSKAIEAKLKKITKSLRKNISQRFVAQKSSLNVSFKADKPQRIKNGEKEKPGHNDSWTSQDLNLLSQENPQFLSQGSQKCSQSVEAPLVLSQEQVPNKLNVKMGQSANQRLSEMKFIPQNQKCLYGVEDASQVLEKRAHGLKFPGK